MGLECVRLFTHCISFLVAFEFEFEFEQCVSFSNVMKLGFKAMHALRWSAKKQKRFANAEEREREKGYMNSMNCMGLDYSGLFYKSHICYAQYECAILAIQM